MSESPTPYVPPKDNSPIQTTAYVHLSSVVYPNEPSQCSYYSYEDFAALFHDRVIRAFAQFGVQAIGEAVDAQLLNGRLIRVSAEICHLTDYHISSWNNMKRWLLPFLGYQFRPASFEIVGRIEWESQAPVPYRLFRTFQRGRLGERANMLIGLESETYRIAALALRGGHSQQPDTAGHLWIAVFVVPLVVAIIGLFSTYMLQPLSVPPVLRGIRAVLASIAAGSLTLGSLPEGIYRNSRVAYLYRLTAAKSDWELRAFPWALGFITGGLAIASFVYGNE